MKNFLLAIVVVLSSYGASAQQVALDNYASCDYYVTLVFVNPSCTASQDITVFVPSGAVNVASPVPPPGWVFNRALVHYLYPAHPSAYYVKIESPWANCPIGLNLCEYDAGCTGAVTESCVDGYPSVPRVVIAD